MRSMMSPIGTSSSASPGVMFRTWLSSGTKTSSTRGKRRGTAVSCGPWGLADGEVVQPPLFLRDPIPGDEKRSRNPAVQQARELELRTDPRRDRERCFPLTARGVVIADLHQARAFALANRGDAARGDVMRRRPLGVRRAGAIAAL